MSVSKIECKATVRGKGEFTVGIYRHLAPLTVSALLRELPMNSRVTIYPKAMVCLLTGIRTGVEKQRLDYAKGEVAFFAANGSICFFTANVKSQRPLNPIGKVESNLDLLEKLSPGDVIEIVQLQEIQT